MTHEIAVGNCKTTSASARSVNRSLGVGTLRDREPFRDHRNPRDISPRLDYFPGHMKRFAFAILAALAVSAFASARAADAPKAESSSNSPKKDPVSSTNEVAIIKTLAGEIVVEFWSDVAPKTVENFKKLARDGFYDGTAFHRVLKGFMIQGGDPLTKDASMESRWGTGDPGYKIKAEFSSKRHVKGVLSMARSNDPDSAGSQFFICHGDATFLDNKYTAFGKVLKGEDVIDKIANCEKRAGGEGSKPVQRQGVESVKIVDRATVK